MKLTYILSILLLLSLPLSHAEGKKPLFTISGTISTIENGKKVPLDYAVLSLKPTGLYSSSDEKGAYKIEGLEAGEYTLSIQLIGYMPLDTTLHIRQHSRSEYNFILKENNFRLQDVVVTAQRNKAGESTASQISRQAIDHSLTSSLQDIMQLLPGAQSANPDLSTSQALNIRTASHSIMNSLGTAIIVDDAPLSNNANMEGISSAMTGISGTIAGNATFSAGSIPNSGIDVRAISTDNIESVEVIRGIPSVQYGDLSSGAVIVKSKTGAEPLQIRLKADPKIYQSALSKGFKLPRRLGELHLSGDYAYSNARTTAKYQYYQRLNIKGVWSQGRGSLHNTTSLELKFNKDTRDRNPDDKRSQIASAGRDLGCRISISGSININKGWWKSIKYSLSNSYTDRRSFYEQYLSNAISIYSTNLTDGSTVSSLPGEHIFDTQGKEVTHFSSGQLSDYAKFMPYEYFSRYDFYSKELNTFGKLSLNFFHSHDNISNGIILGADFKSDGNLGEGLVFPEGTPPHKSDDESGYRARQLHLIPFVRQFSIYAEDAFKAQLWQRKFHFTIGLRHDIINKLQALSPRLNISCELLPNALILRGGCGITAKAPTVAYLHPNPVYYDQVNYNSLNAADPKDRIAIATTYVFDSSNPQLQIAKNRKAEIGFDLNIAKHCKIAVTAYDEVMDNGYAMGLSRQSIKWLPYKFYIPSGSYDAKGHPILQITHDTHKFFTFYMPLNCNYERNYGVEYDINIGRFESIRTAFHLNGAWLHSLNYSTEHSYDINHHNGSEINSHVAIYDPGMAKYHAERWVNSLRITHNLPKIGFVLTLTTHLCLYEKQWTQWQNENIPQHYISNADNKIYPFTAEMAEDNNFKYMIDQRSLTRHIVETHRPAIAFNLNLSKEIKNFLTASFYVNNIFNHRPLDPSEVAPGTYTELNNPMYFGFELKIKI